MCVCVCVYVSVPRKRFLGNYQSHLHQTWHGDCLRHDNTSCINYIDLDLHWHAGRLMHGIVIFIMLMLVSMTLTMMQGHSGSAKANIQYRIISTTKQATSII